jgi:hypothetical protein
MSRGLLLNSAMQLTQGYARRLHLKLRLPRCEGPAISTGGPLLIMQRLNQRSNRPRVILENSAPTMPRFSACRVVGTSNSRNVCLMSIRRRVRQTARTNICVLPSRFTTLKQWDEAGNNAMPSQTHEPCSRRMPISRTKTRCVRGMGKRNRALTCRFPAHAHERACRRWIGPTPPPCLPFAASVP